MPHQQTLTRPAMTASQMRIAETIDAFYGDAGTRDGVSRSYKQAVEDLDAETIKALDGPYRYCRRNQEISQAKY
jgi:bridging integrator 3